MTPYIVSPRRARRTLVDQWRSGSTNNQKFSDVKRELERRGFTFETKGNHVYKVKHPALVGSPHFPFGFIGIKAHYGEKGDVKPEVIKDVLRALKWIEEHEPT